MGNWNRTQEEVLNYIKRQTKQFKQADSELFTAHYLAGEMNISRNSASQYLNEFTKAGYFLKINSRPVYFFHKETLEELYQIPISKDEFKGISELVLYLERSAHKKRNFEKAIGCDAGLSYEISQCRMAMEYPPEGLPMLLVGQNGTGKSLLAQLSYEYAADNRILEPDKCKFQVFRSLLYGGNQEEAKKQLFGWNGQPGLLDEENQEMLYIKDVHLLSREIQEQIALRLESKRIIFSGSPNIAENISRVLLEKIPIIVRLPLLDNRSIAEKERLIISCFKQESNRIKRRIFISQKVLEILLNFHYENNIRQLKASIKTSCINAFQQGDENSGNLSVNAMHLPEDILGAIRVTASFRETDQKMLDIDALNLNVNSDRELMLYESLIKHYDSYEKEQTSFSDMLDQGVKEANAYFDYLIFEKNFSNEKIRAIERVLNQIFQTINEQYEISITANFAMVLAKIIYNRMRTGARKNQVESNLLERSEGLYQLLAKKCPQEMTVAVEITGLVQKNLEWEIRRFEMLMLIMKLHQYKEKIHGLDINAVIICHGYSTAGSIADVVNQTLGKRVFDSMDMPMDMNVSVIADKVKRYVESCQAKNIILLVDLGSLETLDSAVRQQFVGSLGIMNNVSTRLALDVGGKILQRMAVPEILEKASMENQVSYRLIEAQKKEDAILFVSELNSDVAEKVSRLFMNSLPRKIEISLVCYEYSALQNYKTSIGSQYHILFVAGTIDPFFQNVPFVYLEDIISFKKIDTVNEYLEGYLDEAEREQFQRNLLKNFSLQNVIEYLTILNADKVLEFADDTLEQLQIALGQRFSAKTVIGLNIHICCMVERLVKKAPISSHINEKEFVNRNSAFIDSVTKCFRNITSHYGVELPTSEIAYIYDYIYHD